MNPSGTTSGPQWATPNGISPNQTITQVSMEEEFFAPYSTLDEPVMETIMRDVRSVGSKLKVVLLPMDRSVSVPYFSPYSMFRGDLFVSSLSSVFRLSFYLAAYFIFFPSSYNVRLPWTSPSPCVLTFDFFSPFFQLPYGGYAGVSQTESVELTDRDKQIIESLRDWDLWGPLIVCLALAVLLSLKAPEGQASLVFAAVFCAVWLGSTVVTINAQLLGGTISFFQSVCVLGYCVFPMTMAAAVVDLFKMVPLGAFSTLVEIAVLAVAFVWSTRASSVFIGQYVVASRRILAVFPVLFFYTFLAWLIFLF